MDNNTTCHFTGIRLSWSSDPSSDFGPMLQKGVRVKARLGNIRSVLCEELGVSFEYLDKQINTIFLDGRSVDKVDSAIIKPGSVLALSGAMPGFVGAAFRKGGYYAEMRKNITYAGEEELQPQEEGLFTVKLYNFVVRDLGSVFLKSGIRLQDQDLADLLNRPDEFWAHCIKIEINDSEIGLEDFKSGKWAVQGKAVVLMVNRIGNCNAGTAAARLGKRRAMEIPHLSET